LPISRGRPRGPLGLPWLTGVRALRPCRGHMIGSASHSTGTGVQADLRFQRSARRHAGLAHLYCAFCTACTTNFRWIAHGVGKRRCRRRPGQSPRPAIASWSAQPRVSFAHRTGRRLLRLWDFTLGQPPRMVRLPSNTLRDSRHPGSSVQCQ
jgi:hypothetical protein